MHHAEPSKLKNETTTAGRIKMARLSLNLTQAELCEKSGMKVSTLKNYEHGSSEPSSESLRQFLSLGINPAWIIAGVSPMLNLNAKPVVYTVEEQQQLVQKSLAEIRTLNQQMMVLGGNLVNCIKDPAAAEKAKQTLDELFSKVDFSLTH